MQPLRVRAIWFTLTSTLASALALASCKGCDEGDPPPAVTAYRVAQPDSAKLHARVDARKLDRTKVYPKAADGSVTCGKDKDCFIVQAETCTKAEMAHTEDMSGFGVLQRVDYLYRIEGREAGQCRATRRVTALGVQLSDLLLDLLHNKGKTDADIQAMKDETDENLRMTNPTLYECWFGDDAMLEAAVDLAEGKFKPQVWRDACREPSANVLPPADAFAPTDGH